MLEISENTGISDVAIDPANPDVMLAVAHQRRRHTWTLIHGGPESGLHKSTDGGKTWRRIRAGLPTGDVGRIVIAFSPAQKGLVYAKVESSGQPVAIYASLDCRRQLGAPRQRAGAADVLQEHPSPIRRIPIASTCRACRRRSPRTAAAPSTQLGERNKHVDNHYVWIDPDDTDHLLEGCDGGLYESWDRGRLWRHFTNLSVTQFYNVEVDNASPIYNVYGGTQDNSTLGGPSRSRTPDGATNNDWFIVTGGDGFVARVDPTDPNIVYAESQYGGIVRLDRRTSERVSIRPVEGKGEAALRFNWESPFVISPHSPSRLYFGANRLFRSDDRGNTLARGQPRPDAADRSQPAAGDGPRVAARSRRPAPVDRHLGQHLGAQRIAQARGPAATPAPTMASMQFSLDGGANWRKSENPPGLPDYGSYGVYVQRLQASKIDENVVYALYENTKNGDFKPYIYKSTNRGGDLDVDCRRPAGQRPGARVRRGSRQPEPAVRRHRVRPVLHRRRRARSGFGCATNLPTIPVRDLAIQERENDLVLATFGRGFYVLDDYSPLRQLTADVFQKDGHIFPGKAGGDRGARDRQGARVPGRAALDGREPAGGRGDHVLGSRDAAHAAAAPAGCRARARSRRRRRRRIRRRRSITAEEDEEAPQTFLTISDAAGKVVRRLVVPGARGIHRFAWNLRGVPATLPGAGRWWRRWRRSAAARAGGASFVPPGTYRASLSRRAGGVTHRARRSADHHGLGRSRRDADTGCAHGGDRVPGQGREAAAVVHGRAGTGQQHEDAHDGHPARDRGLDRRPQAAGRSGAVRSTRDGGAARAPRRRDAARAGVGLAVVDSVARQLRRRRRARPDRRAHRHAADRTTRSPPTNSTPRLPSCGHWKRS